MTSGRPSNHCCHPSHRSRKAAARTQITRRTRRPAKVATTRCARFWVWGRRNRRIERCWLLCSVRCDWRSALEAFFAIPASFARGVGELRGADDARDIIAACATLRAPIAAPEAEPRAFPPRRLPETTITCEGSEICEESLSAAGPLHGETRRVAGAGCSKSYAVTLQIPRARTCPANLTAPGQRSDRGRSRAWRRRRRSPSPPHRVRVTTFTAPTMTVSTRCRTQCAGGSARCGRYPTAAGAKCVPCQAEPTVSPVAGAP